MVQVKSNFMAVQMLLSMVMVALYQFFNKQIHQHKLKPQQDQLNNKQLQDQHKHKQLQLKLYQQTINVRMVMEIMLMFQTVARLTLYAFTLVLHMNKFMSINVHLVYFSMKEEIYVIIQQMLNAIKLFCFQL